MIETSILYPCEKSFVVKEYWVAVSYIAALELVIIVVVLGVINWKENNFIIYQDLPRWSIFQLSCSHQHNPRSMLTKQWGVLFHQTEGQKQKSNKNCGLGNTALPPLLLATHLHKFCLDWQSRYYLNLNLVMVIFWIAPKPLCQAIKKLIWRHLRIVE